METQTKTPDRAKAESERLAAAREQKVPWKKWGPCLSERQWGTRSCSMKKVILKELDVSDALDVSVIIEALKTWKTGLCREVQRAKR